MLEVEMFTLEYRPDQKQLHTFEYSSFGEYVLAYVKTLVTMEERKERILSSSVAKVCAQANTW